jgi:nucleoside phosphorylase
LRLQTESIILVRKKKQRPRHSNQIFVKKLLHQIVCYVFFGFASSALADTVAFLYALDADHRAFSVEAPSLGNPIKVGGNVITQHRVAGHQVYATKMGSGCVVSAVSVATVLAKFPCDWVVSIGPCGALDPTLAVGTWVRVKSVVGWQLYDSDEVEEAPEKALFDLQARPLASETAFEELVEQTTQVIAASGEMFIRSPATVATLVSDTGASIVEMNALGLATACSSHQVPLVIWRVVSDHANETAPGDFRKFVQSYTGIGGKQFAGWLRKLPSKADRVEDHPELLKLFENARERR